MIDLSVLSSPVSSCVIESVIKCVSGNKSNTPTGFSYIIDNNGNYIIDNSNNYVVEN